MKKLIGNVAVGIGVILALPLLLIVIFILIEIVGYVANNATTYKQTKELTSYIEKSIEDAGIVDVYSFTGNTTGTGNHVECESVVTFNSDMPEDEVARIFDKKYRYHDLEKKDGSYVITVIGDAPFRDNIEGH
ncbi:hypothetical protein [Butyrivibrio sp. LB2008]|uniref:hypothetical protein n=1 Tax=Butyrivibrio sp. LB2008 TaxID=1408305 RepID=UPI000478AA09|nr:hypothetical protein [Butyrivibrio sp. LB2008]